MALAAIHGKNTKVYIDEFDLSSYFNQFDVSTNQEVAETTGFQSSSKTYILGLADATLSGSGMWSADADGSDEELSALLGNLTTPILTIPIGAGTIGNRAWLAKAHELSYQIGSPVVDITSVGVDFQCSSDGVANVTHAAASGVQLTTGASIAFGSLGALATVDNAAATAAGGIGVLHAPTNTAAGGTTTWKIEHSVDDAVWADLLTFTALAASTAGSQLVAVAGTVRRYIRASASTAASSGAITTMVSFARF